MSSMQLRATHITHTPNKQTQQLLIIWRTLVRIQIWLLSWSFVEQNAMHILHDILRAAFLPWYCPGSSEAWLQWGLHKFPTAAKLVQFSLEELHGIHYCQARSHSTPIQVQTSTELFLSHLHTPSRATTKSRFQAQKVNPNLNLQDNSNFPVIFIF